MPATKHNTRLRTGNAVRLVIPSVEYPDKGYNGQNLFTAHYQIEKQNCIQCHMERLGGKKHDHDFFPSLKSTDDEIGCNSCHKNINDCDELGKPNYWENVDYDGDGVGESFRHEIDGMQALLIVQMNAYAEAIGLTAIMYTPGSYPYWAKASCYQSDPSCVPTAAGTYTFPDAKFMGAAYNYHLAQDPGAGIHNHTYVIQLLYDSIEDLGGDVSTLIRPPQS